MVRVALKWRRALAKLGISYTEERVGWIKSRYGFKPDLRLIVSESDYKRLTAYISSTSDTRSKAKANRRSRLFEEAFSMGLLPDSRTFASYKRREISKQEAIRIGNITSHRHECTNYDDLLDRGFSKEDARMLKKDIQ